MRIGIVSETYPPEINGVALTVHSLAAGLAAHGHSVDLIRPRQPQPHCDEPGIDVLSVRSGGLPRYPGLRFGLPASHTLRQHWLQQRPDAIYVATEGPLGWSAVRTAKRLGIPVSSGFHTRFDSYADHYGLGLLTPEELKSKLGSAQRGDCDQRFRESHPGLGPTVDRRNPDVLGLRP